MNIISFIIVSLVSTFLVTDILICNNCKIGTIKFIDGVCLILIAAYSYEISLTLYNILALVFAGNLLAELWIMYKIKKAKKKVEQD